MSRMVSDANENLLRVNIDKFFTDLEHDVQEALFTYYNENKLLKGQLNLILAPIHEKHREYFNLLMAHKLDEFRRSFRIGTLLTYNTKNRIAMKAEPVKFTHNENNLFGTLQYTEQKLAQDTFNASDVTLARVDENINQILTDGYKSGNGINEVSRALTERFDQLRTWESNRIARTEIHTAQNMGIMSSYESLGVEYTQWIAAHDDRTRDSHAELDGEIIRIGDRFSNGLEYPGDKNGDIEEWINCRCSNAPFVMPAGMTAPEGMTQFRESDLVPIGEQQPQTQSIESSNELLGDGTYTKYSETTEHGRTFDVYKFGNVEIAIQDTVGVSIEQFGRHLSNLPEELLSKSYAKRIEFCEGEPLKSEYDGDAGGLYYSNKQQVSVYLLDKGEGIKDFVLNIFDHEFSHSIDVRPDGTLKYSNPEAYEKIVMEDNKIHGDELIDVFPTEYAGKAFLKYNNGHWHDRRYVEDFAESSTLYLRPQTHEEFCRQFPNRAKYLEGIYGKPQFKKTEYSNRKRTFRTTTSSTKVNDILKEYDKQIDELIEQINSLDELRNEYKEKQHACLTDECHEKWGKKRREIRVEKKRLNKVIDEIYDERIEFRKKYT